MSHRLHGYQAPHRAEVVLVADGVHVGYLKDRVVLDCVSVAIDTGTRLAVLGHNGSGKTTLLRCLSGAIKPTSGSVSYCGERLNYQSSDLSTHRERVQLVLQDPDDQLFANIVANDVAYGPANLGLDADDVQLRVVEALAAVGIESLADRAIHQLSYGQRKRVAIAGALAMRPDVLLLDEPTAGLDAPGVASLLAALQSAESAGTTLVMSTHDTDLAWAWADEVAVVAGADVVQSPTAKALTDHDVMNRAGLATPWIVAVLRAAGQHIDLADPPKTASELAAVLQTQR